MLRLVRARNVNDAYAEMLGEVATVIRLGHHLHPPRNPRWRLISPRDGKETLEHVGPVITTYEKPWERVLTNVNRDANPFFHVMEALWILAGRNDVKWLSQFNKNMEQFSDDGKTFYGAYGERMFRHPDGEDWEHVNQVKKVIEMLIAEPDTRRAVVAIWNPFDVGADTKDLPCNTHVYFKLRDGKLGMTVCCRSNDAIWGCYGANAVHFSFLQEYVAASVDAGLGTYTHLSDSFHVYLNNPSLQRHVDSGIVHNAHIYGVAPLIHVPLVSEPATFDQELGVFMDDKLWLAFDYTEEFFRDVAIPMRVAWRKFKHKNMTGALRWVDKIKATDWQIGCRRWLERRRKK